MERWEEGFDTWTPRARGEQGASDDSGVDVDREALLRLARELAANRHAEHEQARAELEQLKQSLRERAAAVAARERELEALQRRLEAGRRERRKPAQPDPDALVARERAALERAQALDARERELTQRAAALERALGRLSERERRLAAEVAAAEERLDASHAEQELAVAERARLEEREQDVRRVEKELAAARIELERERLEPRREVASDAPLADAEPGPESGQLEPGDRTRELYRVEARLEARERELALLRQRLDAERNVLLERERAVRRREAAEMRRSFEPPLAPPGFGDGLAAFVRSRHK
jgi:hypothetical protein